MTAAKKLLRVLLAAVFCLGWALTCLGKEADLFDKFPRPEKWTENNAKGEQVILDAGAVAAFARQVTEVSPSVADLKAYPAAVDGEAVRALVSDYSVLADDLYRAGLLVSENYKNILRKLTNAGNVPATVKVRYALCVRKANLRALPTGEGLFYAPGDVDFDVLQQTVLDPMEPVIVLHDSSTLNFYFVRAANYCGWLSRLDLAFTDRNTWLQYVEPEKFLVVTDRELFLKTGAEQVRYQQGAKLPVKEETNGVYKLNAPVRGKNGQIAWEPVQILKSNPKVHLGYLPYTTNNIIRAAYKWYGAPYGWGGMKNSVDCSSLIYNVYRTVGIRLPRDADQQETTAGRHYELAAAAGEAARLAIINRLQPGSPLFMNGHAVLYLGSVDGIPYCIHSLGSCYEGGKRLRVMQVVVSDLSLERANGSSFLNALTGAVEYK